MWKGPIATLCLVVGACGEVATEKQPDAPPPGPPTVLSISPADKAIGIAGDTNIVITFSRRMDQAATQSAFDSPDIPSSSVVMTWNTDGTVLTIKPNSPLAYAMGNDPAMVTAKTYAITLTTNAADPSGAHLVEPFNASFSTLRRVQGQKLGNTTGLTGTCYPAGSGNRLIVGDNASNTAYRGLVTFNIGALPAGIRTFEVAKLLFNFDGADGSPIPTLGAISVDQVTYPTMATACAAVSRRGCGNLPVSSNTDVGIKMVTITVAVDDDYTNRATLGNLTQYRLGSAVVTDNDGIGDFLHFDTPPNAQLTLDYTFE